MRRESRSRSRTEKFLGFFGSRSRSRVSGFNLGNRDNYALGILVFTPSRRLGASLFSQVVFFYTKGDEKAKCRLCGTFIARKQQNTKFFVLSTEPFETVSGLKLFRSASHTLPTTGNEMLKRADTSFLIYRRFLFLKIVAHLSYISISSNFGRTSSI